MSASPDEEYRDPHPTAAGTVVNVVYKMGDGNNTPPFYFIEKLNIQPPLPPPKPERVKSKWLEKRLKRRGWK
jgi:hypothetical protein